MPRRGIRYFIHRGCSVTAAGRGIRAGWKTRRRYRSTLCLSGCCRFRNVGRSSCWTPSLSPNPANAGAHDSLWQWLEQSRRSSSCGNRNGTDRGSRCANRAVHHPRYFEYSTFHPNHRAFDRECGGPITQTPRVISRPTRGSFHCPARSDH